MKRLSDLHIDGTEHSDKIAIRGDLDGASYHIWIDRETLRPTDDILYKNANDQRTKYLNQQRGIGRFLVPQMLEAARKLAADFEERMAERVRDRERAADLRERLIRKALSKLTAAEIEACGLTDLAEQCKETATHAH